MCVAMARAAEGQAGTSMAGAPVSHSLYLENDSFLLSSLLPSFPLQIVLKKLIITCKEGKKTIIKLKVRNQGFWIARDRNPALI